MKYKDHTSKDGEKAFDNIQQRRNKKVRMLSREMSTAGATGYDFQVDAWEKRYGHDLH